MVRRAPIWQIGMSQVFPYYSIMQANNMPYIGGYIYSLVAGIQFLVLDYIMKEPLMNYPPLSFNLVAYFPRLNVFVPPLVVLKTP